MRFVANEWTPAPVDAGDRLALLLPCTKYRPYPTSREHRAINAALLAAGWEPVGSVGEGERQRAGGWGSDDSAPDALRAVLDPGEDPAMLHAGPLRRGATMLDRLVVCEPLALVPYEHVYFWRGEQSPAASYDDPGLFESRGTSVSPERDDCTAQRCADGSWRWGPAEAIGSRAPGPGLEVTVQPRPSVRAVTWSSTSSLATGVLGRLGHCST